MEQRFEVPLHFILDNPYQPRTTDNAEHIKSLALSIAADGLLQVPTARELNDGTYELAFGHSRRKAFEWLNLNWETEGLPNRYESYWKMPINVEALSDEDMYRQAVSENVQRRDLDPIELAKSMTVYRDLFGKNSDQIGALFGMNGATVRGKLRLLDLNDDVKEKLSSGVISEGTARELLSLQKVAPKEIITKTLQHLEKGVDRWGDEETPARIIDDALEAMDHVKEFWSDVRNGKPQVGSDGWLLDMKKFPNQYLPLLTGHIAVQALDCFNDKDAQKLVLEIADYLDANTAQDCDDEYYKANNNQIEKRMELLAQIKPEYSQRLQHLINPPACNTCPYYTKIKGSHYCGIKHCLDRKTSAWRKQQAFARSKALGMDFYDPKVDGKHLVLEDTYQNSKHAELFKKKNKDLRLAFMADIDRKKYQSGYEGVPRETVVVVTGKTLEKLLKEKETIREEKKKRDPLEIRQKLMDKQVDVLLWESTLYLKSLLDGLTDDAVQSLFDGPRYGWSNLSAVPEDLSGNESDSVIAEHTRREIVCHMLVSGEHDVTENADDLDSLGELAALIVARAKSWKIKIPAAFTKLAAEMDAQIDLRVSAETE